ncbi:MAG: hypothetical protein ACO1N1_19730 [Dyadobacter fermentans]
MNKNGISESLFKCLFLAGLLTACNSNEVVTPTDNISAVADDRNAKILPLTRLVDDSGQAIQYEKSGKFFGKISRVGKNSWKDQYETYTYDDSNPGELWISKKKYKASNNSFISEHKFKIINGLCVQSQNNSGDTFEYKYNAQGYLDEVKKSNQGLLSESWKYQYDWTYRLTKITHQKDGKPYHTYNFTYKQIEDKYPLNFPDHLFNLNGQYIGGSYIGGLNDKYLPIFGKHCSLAIAKITETDDVKNKINTGASIHFSSYATDSDGLVISKKYIQYSALISETYKYSATSWQGLPGNP